MVYAVKEAFENRRLLQQLNATALDMVPKVDHPSKVTQFRPLACCNIIYKVISKVLAERLKRILPSLISNTQGAFVLERSLKHNILLCQEIVSHYMHTNISPRCMLKIDFL